MVFYRKYRPQRISELDSESVRHTLSSVLATKEIAHAFLFTGPKGLGKTSAARIVAKVVNCLRRKDLEPCNKCEQCISITNGTNLDLIEIDAASNRGIDEIRDLREKIKLAPSSAKKKMYIIDEVHMLTTEAFNALLKTLEEPPEHAMFILATTDPHKVPQTIQSRCFHIAFKRATENEILRSLKRIVAAEKIAIDQDALLKIANASDGSFRDASKLLEQARALAGRKKILSEFVDQTLGGSTKSDDFMRLIKVKNTKEALLWLNKGIDGGLNIKTWLEDLLSMLHSMLLYKYNVQNGEVASELRNFSEEELKELISLFSRSYQELRTAVIPQLPVELAIIKYCMDKRIENSV